MAFAGQGGTITAQYASLQAAPGSSATVAGTGNIIYLTPNSGTSVGVSGQSETVAGDSGSNQVNLQGTGTNATVDGGGNVGLTASGQTLTLGDQGSTVTTRAGVQSETIAGSGEFMYTQGAINGSNFVGDNNTLNLAANSGSGIGLMGTGNTVNGAGGNYIPIYNAGASTTVNGAGSVVLDASGQTLNLGSSGATVTTASGVQSEFVHFAQGGSLSEGDGSRVDVFGDNVTDSVGTNDILGSYGSGVTVHASGSGDGVWIGSNGQNATAAQDDHVAFAQGGSLSEADNSRVDVTGDNVVDSIGANDTLGAYGSGVTVNASGGGDAVWVGSNGQFASGAQDDHVNFAQGGSLNEVDNSRVDVSGSAVTDNIGTNDLLGASGSDVTVNASGSNDSVWIGGNGQNATYAQDDHVNFAQGGSVTETDNARVDVSGNSVYETIGSNDTLGASGSGDIVNTLGGGDGVWVTGQNNTVNGSGDNITYAANTRGDVDGNNDTVTLQGNTGDHLGIDGTGELVTGDSGSDHVNLQGNNSTATIDGGGVVGLTGSGQTLTLGDQGSTVQTAPGLQGETVNGSGETIDALGSISGSNVVGSNDTLNLAANSGSGIGLVGSGDVVTGADGNYIPIYDAGANTTVDGAGSVVLDASGQTLNLGSSGASVTTAAGVQGETIAGSGEFMYTQGPIDSSNVVGNNDTLNLAANSGSGIGLIGSGNTVNGAAGNYIPIYDAGATTTVNGAGSVVLDASGQTLNLGSSGATVTAAASVQNEAINGSGDGITFAPNASGNISGANDTINLQANGNNNIGVFGQNQTVTGDSGNDGVNLGGNGTSATVDGGGYVGLVGSEQTLTLGNSGSTVLTAPGVQNEAINGSGDGITFAPNAGGTVNGSSNTINLSGGDDLGASGGGNTINGGPGERISVSNTNGNFDNIDASNDRENTTAADGQTAGVYVSDHAQINLNGTGDGYTNGTGSSVAFTSTAEYDSEYSGNSPYDLGDHNGNGPSDPYNGDDPWGGGGGGDDGGGDDGDGDPLILNLDHGSVQTVDVDQSPSRFDMQNDGHVVQTGWGTPGEGYLVDLPSGRQTVTDAADLVPTFATLQALDTNHDGVLDAHDAAWSNLKVWVDTAGTAVSQPGSLHSLSDLGIVSIDLNATPDGQTNNGNTILSDGSFTWADGSHGDIADVSLRYLPNASAASTGTPAFDPATQTQASQLVAAMSTFGVSSASENTVQATAPSAQASLTVDPTAAQAHRLAA